MTRFWILAVLGFVILGWLSYRDAKAGGAPSSKGDPSSSLGMTEKTAGHGSAPYSVAENPKWGAEKRLTSDAGDSKITYNFSHSIAVDPSGAVHIVWYDTRDGKPQVYYERSTDGGKTWGPDTRLSDQKGAAEHPSIAVSGNYVYAAWHTTGAGNGINIHFRRSSDGGDTWAPEVALTTQGADAHNCLSADGSAVQISWGDSRTGEAEMYTRRSNDYGKTWSPEVRISDLPWDSWVPTVQIAGPVTYAAWVDTRDGNEEEYFARSMDGGKTFGPNIRLTDNRMNSWAPSIAINGNTVYYFWFDQKDNAQNPLDVEKKLDAIMITLGLHPEPEPSGVVVQQPNELAKRRADQKMHFIVDHADGWAKSGGDGHKLQAIMHEFEGMAKPKNLGEAIPKLQAAMTLIGLPVTSPPKGADLLRPWAEATMKQIQETGPKWVKNGGDPHALEAKLKDFEQIISGGAGAGTYMAKERKLDEAIALMGLPFTLAPITDVPKVYYEDAMSARIEDKMQQIQQAGLAWVKRGGDPRQLESRLKAFEKEMQPAFSEWEIYYKVSRDGGKNWGPDTRLTHAPGSSQRPSMAVHGNDVHVAWFDNRDGNQEVYYKHLADGGKTWRSDVRITNAPGDSMQPSLAVGPDGAVHIVWYDNRDGNNEIYYVRTLN